MRDGDGLRADRRARTLLEVSTNGVTFTTSGVLYTFYDPRTAIVSRLLPSGGPRSGGTFVTLVGAGFLDLSSKDHQGIMQA